MIRRVIAVCTLLVISLSSTSSFAAPRACPEITGVWDFTFQSTYREFPSDNWPNVNLSYPLIQGCFIIKAQNTRCFFTIDLFDVETGNCSTFDPNSPPDPSLLFGVGSGEMKDGRVVLNIGGLDYIPCSLTGSVDRKGTSMSFVGSNFNAEKGCECLAGPGDICADGRLCGSGNPAVSSTMRAWGAKRQ